METSEERVEGVVSGGRFPVKTALAAATCVLALGAWRQWRDGSKGIPAAVVVEVLPWRRAGLERGPVVPPAVSRTGAGKAVVAPDMEAGVSIAGAGTVPGAGGRSAISEVLEDEGGALDPFFAALARAEAGGAGEPVTILHYGDSPTTADLITGDVRAMLQRRFGNGGHGYLLISKPWAWYGHRDTDVSSKGWSVSTAVGKGRAEVYGLGGAAFVGAAGASSRISLKDGAGGYQTAMTVEYLAEPGGGTLAVTADTGEGKGQALATISTGAEARHPAWQTVTLPAGTRAVDLKVTAGRVTADGVTFARGTGGLVYSSLGLNGASTTVLSRGFDAGAWAAELQHDRPTLVVINYGTNESSFGSFVDRQYEGELRATIGRIRNALPGVSILVMSPMDRGERAGIAEINTMETIPRIVAIQRRVAAETHCAFFDTFDAMGGDGTMERWYTGHPRLVAGDLIHPTPQGAAMVAELFVKNLMAGYAGYEARVGKPAAEATVEAGQR